MIALLLAAAVAGHTTPVLPREVARPPTVEPMPNAFHEPAYCPSVVEKEVRRQEVALQGRVTGLQYAVLRKLDGCMVPAPVGYHPALAAPAPARPGDAPSGKR